MKLKISATLFIFLFLLGCGENESTQNETGKINQENAGNDPVKMDSLPEKISPVPDKEIIDTPGKDEPVKTYSNARFREVRVQKTSEDTYRVRGKGQIFEANFGWVVEDGHNEIAKGYQMTDAGAPEWGNFDFTIKAKKERQNSTLTLVLFESSAKDGSRQHQLPVPLQ